MPVRHAAALALAAALLPQTPVHAQVPEPSTDDRALVLEGIRFFPFLRLAAERNDNVFQQSDTVPGGRVEATILNATPGVLVEIPYSHSRARLGYALHVRDQGASASLLDQDGRDLNHFVLADTRLRFGTGWELGMRDDFESGVLESAVFDPAGELTFTGQRFRRNRAEVEVVRARGAAGRLALEVSRLDHELVRGDRGTGARGLFDLDELELRLAGEHALSPRLGIVWDAATVRGEVTRPEPLPAFFEERESSARAGLRLRGAGRTTIDGRLGLSRFRFEDRLTPSGPAERTSTLVGSVDVERILPRHVQVAVAIRRDLYPSVVTGNDFLVSEQLRAQVRASEGRRLAWGAIARLVRNRYEVASRRDRLVAGEAWIGYRFGRWIEWQLYVRDGTRDAEVPGHPDLAEAAEYDELRIGTAVNVGGW